MLVISLALGIMVGAPQGFRAGIAGGPNPHGGALFAGGPISHGGAGGSIRYICAGLTHV